jgi:hypothetical protein
VQCPRYRYSDGKNGIATITMGVNAFVNARDAITGVQVHSDKSMVVKRLFGGSRLQARRTREALNALLSDKKWADQAAIATLVYASISAASKITSFS